MTAVEEHGAGGGVLSTCRRGWPPQTPPTPAWLRAGFRLHALPWPRGPARHPHSLPSRDLGGQSPRLPGPPLHLSTRDSARLAAALRRRPADTAAKRGFHHGTCSALGGGLNPAAVTSWPCPARHFTAPSLRLHLRKRRGEATPLGTVTQITYTVTCGDRYHDTETRSTVSTQTFACVGKTTVRVGLKLDKKGQRRVCKSKRNEPVQDGGIKGSEGLSGGRAAGSGEQVAEKPKLGARECRTPAEGPTVFHTRERGPLRGELARRALE